jgi:AcrR family transcriptional regulator
MEMFWRQGYASTSIAGLTAAMGINPPSLYAAFGDKRPLLEEALALYAGEHARYLVEAMAEPTARRTVRRFLIGTAEAATLPNRPAGCLTVQGGPACAEEDREVVALLAAHRGRTRQALLERFEKAVADGDLPEDTDCRALALCVVAAAQGLNVEAASGTPREELPAAAKPAAAVVPGL